MAARSACKNAVAAFPSAYMRARVSKKNVVATDGLSSLQYRKAVTYIPVRIRRKQRRQPRPDCDTSLRLYILSIIDLQDSMRYPFHGRNCRDRSPVSPHNPYPPFLQNLFCVYGYQSSLQSSSFYMSLEISRFPSL